MRGAGARASGTGVNRKGLTQTFQYETDIGKRFDPDVVPAI
jgi:hypothetical protein